MYKAKNKEFSRILLPIDGLESSMKAADYAIAIARKKGENNNAKLIALHFINSEIKHVYFTYSSVDLSIKGPLGELYRMLRDRLRHGSIKLI